MRKPCKAAGAHTGGGLLWPLLRWKSIHVMYRESTTLSKVYLEFCRWAHSIGFDTASIKNFESLFTESDQDLVKAQLQGRLTAFEFATDGYNLMSLLHFEPCGKNSRDSGVITNFLSHFAMTRSTVQTAPLVGLGQNEFVFGLLHARLPQRLQTSHTVWILTDGLDALTTMDQQPLKEVG